VTRWSAPAPRCGEHGCWDGWREPVATWPNVVTAARTVVAVVLGTLGAVRAQPALLLAALGVYWAGDVADGWLARRLRQETRRGAAFDVLADRACAVAFWLPWAAFHPQTAPAVALYLLEFVVVDGVLSLAWLSWPLLSCNYVGRVHRAVYLLNWWPPAKVANTAGLVAVMLVWRSPGPALVFVGAVLAVKSVSLALLLRRLPAPGPGCARRVAPRHLASGTSVAMATDVPDATGSGVAARRRVTSGDRPPP
jgi:phosphatidylglycerophosphate synthase